MNPLALGAGFIAIFLIGGPLTGGNTTLSIGIGIAVYFIANILLSGGGNSSAPSEHIPADRYEAMSIKELQSIIDHEELSTEHRQYCKNILKKKKRDKKYHAQSS